MVWKLKGKKNTGNTETNASGRIEKSQMEIGVKDGETGKGDKPVWWLCGLRKTEDDGNDDTGRERFARICRLLHKERYYRNQWSGVCFVFGWRMNETRNVLVRAISNKTKFVPFKSNYIKKTSHWDALMSIANENLTFLV